MLHIGTYWATRIFGDVQESPQDQDGRKVTPVKATRLRQRMKDIGIGLSIGVAQVALLGLGITYGLPGFLTGIGAEVVTVGGYLLWRLQKQQQQILQIQAMLDRALQRMIEASPYALIPGPPDPPRGGVQLDVPQAVQPERNLTIISEQPTYWAIPRTPRQSK